VPTTRPVPFAVQGLVTDQLAQMIFNKALGLRPSRAVTAAVAADAADDAVAAAEPYRPGLKVCMDCPPGLLPFNVKPQAEATCHDGLPAKEFKSHYTPVLPECPAWCFAQSVDSVTETKSGAVHVRDCNVEKTKVGKSRGR
jgi:hypothetical protein